MKMGMFFQEITSITGFPGSNFKKVANGIFRWQICYLLSTVNRAYPAVGFTQVSDITHCLIGYKHLPAAI